MALPLAPMGLLLLIGAFLRRSGPEASSVEPMPPPGVLEQPQPFPQVAPTGLPPFPGGWQYYQPPPHAVVVRAWQLLKDLWTQGEGSYKVEQTAGEWVAYRAEKMADGTGALTVKGVTAWHPRPGAPSVSRPPPPVSRPPPPSPSAMPAPYGASVQPVAIPLPPLPASFVQPAKPPPPVTLPPTQIQIALNAAGAMPSLQVDGKLGPKSIAAVKQFQRQHPPLAVDGQAGPQTQAVLARYLAGPA